MIHLESIGFIRIKKGWIQAKKFAGKEIINAKFQFTLNDLKNAKAFTNKLYTCLFQASAMLYGKRKEKKVVLFPQAKHDSGGFMPKGIGSSDAPLFQEIKKTEFIQNQSSSYLAKFANRHEQTIHRRQKEIKKYNCLVLRENAIMSYQSALCRTVLTEGGFLTKEYSKVVHFDRPDHASSYLSGLKETDSGMFKKCYVTAANHGGYSIVKPLPHKYFFSVPCSEIYQNFDWRFKPKAKKSKEKGKHEREDVLDNAFDECLY